jgi:DNA-nicking Smr family endonuclease
MDFGSILDQWEEETARPRGKKAGKPRKNSAETGRASVPGKVDAISAWIRIHGVYDKDAEAEEEEAGRGERRRRLIAKKPDAIIDLHGLTREEAWEALEAFFQDAAEKNFEKILVVHGKGNHSDGEGVLRRLCREFIERCPLAGESGYGNSATGGKGATWVLLKKNVL